ncbi:8-oxo-dGTP diphosphatase [Candidatus Saccharibacteria bacterium]|nr:8-oxo-dGTP diphosphatase [Candidatus Saccharibacteria bacterium]
MKLAEFKKKVPHPLRPVTLILLVDEDRVLLAMKKRGFGEGWWNGVGGKVEEGETIELAAKREAYEEIAVRPTKLNQAATINFYFLDEPIEKNWNQQMHVFLCDSWAGEPKESEEMRPEWHAKSRLPIDKMWPGDRIWMPKVLAGEKVKADLAFNANKEVEEHIIY